jgi:peptidoglycan/LPS O-acetylase OafA/YrhL
MSNNPRKYNLPRDIPGLQALRGIAVLAVVASHLHVSVSEDPYFATVTPWSWTNQALSRGFLGVDLFFVLSGFLITSLLFRDGEMNSAPMLRRFYARRALRLLPALYALLFTSLVIAIYESFPLEYQWNSTWRALLFMSNWKFQSVFLRTQDDIGHLWSLAVEEQFYIIWPLFFIFLRRVWTHWITTVVVLSFIVLAIALYRDNLWNSEIPWLFIYPSTEARADAILIGCICAYVYRYLEIPPRLLQILGYTSAVTLLLVGYQYAIHDQKFLYKGGFTLIAILNGVIILATAKLPTFGGRMLHSKILKWWGQRSYGMYLWHFLVFRLLSRHNLFSPSLLRITVALTLSVAVTEASWRWIEQPFIRVKDRRFSH